tara:strand:+ start:1025 stop:1213 length:189 start_codon:yes stop_codon:yes gene_type:complete
MSINIPKNTKQVKSARDDRERELYFMLEFLRKQLKKKNEIINDLEIKNRILINKNKVIDERN